jgi:hypothetical protein
MSVYSSSARSVWQVFLLSVTTTDNQTKEFFGAENCDGCRRRLPSPTFILIGVGFYEVAVAAVING